MLEQNLSRTLRSLSHYFSLAKLSSLYKLNQSHHLDCEQALWGPLAAGQEKEGRLARMSLEFEYPHLKVVVNADHIILGMCFSMFAYIHAHFCFALIGGNLIA